MAAGSIAPAQILRDAEGLETALKPPCPFHVTVTVADECIVYKFVHNSLLRRNPPPGRERLPDGFSIPFVPRLHKKNARNCLRNKALLSSPSCDMIKPSEMQKSGQRPWIFDETKKGACNEKLLTALSMVLVFAMLLSAAASAAGANSDTLVNWDIKITTPEDTTAVLKGNNYYIYPQTEGYIPYVMVTVYNLVRGYRQGLL